MIELHLVAADHFLPLLVAELIEEVLVVLQGHLLLMSELKGTHTTDEHMAAVIHHPPRQADGVLHVLHTGHGTRAQIAAVHQTGIHLVLAIGIEHRTATSVEERRILQGTHGGLHRVQRGTALLQYGMTAA